MKLLFNNLLITNELFWMAYVNQSTLKMQIQNKAINNPQEEEIFGVKCMNMN